MFIIPNITRDLVLWIRRRYGMSKFRKYTSCVCLFYLYPTMDFSLGLYDNRVTFSVRMYIFAGEKKWKTFFQWSFLFIDWRKKKSLVFMFYLPYYNVYFFSDSLYYYNANFMEILLFHLKYRGLFLVSEEMYCFNVYILRTKHSKLVLHQIV